MSCKNRFAGHAFGEVPDSAHLPASWTADVQQIFYAICDEFEHARDDEFGGELYDAPDPGWAISRSWKLTATANESLVGIHDCRG